MKNCRSLAAIYHYFNGTVFNVDPGSLGFSVALFCFEAAICITIIVARRSKFIGGELGGPMIFRVRSSAILFYFQFLTSGFFLILWLSYLGFSALEAYCVIAGF